MDLFKNNLVAGVGMAFAATVLAPIILPVAGRVGRPLAKTLVRGAMGLYERGREVVAVAGETVEDIMAEIRAESAMAGGAAAAATSTAAPAAPGADADAAHMAPPSASAAGPRANSLPDSGVAHTSATGPDELQQRRYGGNGAGPTGAGSQDGAGPEAADI